MGSESNPDPEPISPSPHKRLTLRLHAATTKKENATIGPTTTGSATGEPQQPSTPSRDSDVEATKTPYLASPFTPNPTMRRPRRTTRNRPSLRLDEEGGYSELTAGPSRGRLRNHADADPPAVLKGRDDALPNAAVPTPLNRRLRDAAARQGAARIDLRGIDPAYVRGRVPALRGASRSGSVDVRGVEPRQRRAAGRAARGGSHSGVVGLEGEEKVEDGGRYQSRYQIDLEDFTTFGKMLAHVPEGANSVYVPDGAEFASMYLNAPVSIDVDGEPRALDEPSWSEERAEVEYLADYFEAKYRTDPDALKKPMAE